MENRVQKAHKAESELKCFKLRATLLNLACFSPLYRFLCPLSCLLCFIFCIFFASALRAEEGSEEEGGIELPPVQIEIIDTTYLDIPREKFRSFTKPDPGVYAPLSPKERPWYVPSTSVPEKFRAAMTEAEKDSLLSLTAQFGVPQALAYQALLVRGFGDSEMLLDVGRWDLRSDRTAELVDDPSKRLDSTTVDRLKGSFAYQVEDSNFRADAQYNARRLGFLGESDEEQPNDRSLIGFSANWGQRLSDDARSSLNFDLSSLKMVGPSSSGDANGLELKTAFALRLLWPRSNPIDLGLGVEYSDSEVEATDSSQVQGLKEAILRLSFRDNYIRMWRFVLGFGLEFALDNRKGSDETADWDSSAYLNPCIDLTSQIGARTTLKLGVERYVLRQDFSSLYLDRDYVRLNPGLDLERTWDMNAALQFRLARTFAVTIGASDKEIRDLIIFEEVVEAGSDGVLSWEPNSLPSARILDFRLGWELFLMNGRIKQSFEYVHEEHDEEIPYRPEDRGNSTITFFVPFGLELSLSGEFRGARHVDTDESSDETLSSYFLLKPRISKTFGKYASVFVMAELYFGDDDYQIWEGYGLPDQTVDFGLTLKF